MSASRSARRRFRGACSSRAALRRPPAMAGSRARQGAAGALEGEIPTIAAPILTALMYLLIFSHALEAHVAVLEGKVRYTAFRVHGARDDVGAAELVRQLVVVADTVEITGNLIFVLLPPRRRDLRCLRAGGDGARADGGARRTHVTLGSSGTARHLASVLGAGVRAFSQRDPRHPRTARRHLGRQVRPARGLPELHHCPAHVPLGRVLSIQTLPPFWQLVSAFHPFFPMIDGFRYGFFGLSDARDPELRHRRGRQRWRCRC